MTNKLTKEEKALLASFRTGRSKEEIFDGIAATIRGDGHMTEEDSRKTARRWIGFCEFLLKTQVRIDRDKEQADADLKLLLNAAGITPRQS